MTVFGPLKLLIQAWTRRSEEAPTLLGHFHRHVTRLLANKPPCYYPEQRRSEESRRMMASEVFSRCDQKRDGERYGGRTPFVAFAEAPDLDDPQIRGYTFYYRYSIAKEAIRWQRSINRRQDPELDFRERIYDQVHSVLVATCERRGQGRWQLRESDIPTLARTIPEVTEQMRHRGHLPRPGLTVEVIRAFGRPVTQREVAEVLQDIVPPPPQPHTRSAGLGNTAELAAELAPLRAGVTAAWRALSANDRELVRAVVRGERAALIMKRIDNLNSRPAVSRATKRIADGLLRSVLESAERFELSEDDRGAWLRRREEDGDPRRGGGHALPQEKMSRAFALLVLFLPQELS